VDSWKNKRVRYIRALGGFWSDINPAAQRLAQERVLASTDGAEAWDALGEYLNALGAAGADLPLCVHLWYADEPGTVVHVEGEGGIKDMAGRLSQAHVRFFPKAAHSIHNSARQEFINALCAVIDKQKP